MVEGSGDEYFLPSIRSGDGLFGHDETDRSFLPAASSTVDGVEHAVDVRGRDSASEPSHVNFNHAVGAAWNSLPTTVVEPVWNSGFWKCIFGNEPLGSNLDQRFKRPLPVPGSTGVSNSTETDADALKKQCLIKTAVCSEPFFRNCVKCTDDLSWQEQREAHLQRALKHWLVIISSWTDTVDFVQCIAGCDSVNSQLIS